MFGVGIVYHFLNFLLTVIGDLGSYCVGRGDNFPSPVPCPQPLGRFPCEKMGDAYRLASRLRVKSLRSVQDETAYISIRIVLEKITKNAVKSVVK